MIDKVINEIKVWDNWQNNYKNFVPLFIEEAKIKNNWTEWDNKVFQEFFEKNRDQCVASLQQGYYSHDEKLKIKNNWSELAQMLSKISYQQDTLDLETYDKIRNWLRQFTTQNRKASANRLIASLQPKLLCTIVNEDRIKVLMQRINKNDSSASLVISNNWFENSNRVLNYFKNKLPNKDYYEIITYPWQTYDILNNQNNSQNSTPIYNNNDMSEIQDETNFLEILQYKKQIILQGPPGTGKTRLAKKIVNDLLINIEFFKNKLQSAFEFIPINFDREYKPLIIKSISNDIIHFNGTSSIPAFSFTISDTYECYISGEWKNNTYTEYPEYAKRALVRHLFHNEIIKVYQNQFKLIQFHPSYTYEDFVRGIVAESKGEKIEYKNVNKTLGEFAEKALENYQDARKSPEIISKETWLREKYEGFKDKIEKDLESGELLIKDGTKPKITAIEDDAVRVNRYSDEKDSVLIKDSDIINGYNGLYFSNPIIKIKDNSILSKSARSGMYYLYQNLIEKFKNYLEENNLLFGENLNVQKIKEKPFVLIIDEINRANLSSVLGELIYALEYRGETVDSMYEVEEKKELILPPNLYIIGTMNTADRSVGHIDYAIRRRFAFVDVLPEKLHDTDEIYFNTHGFEAVEKLFTKSTVSGEFEVKDVQLGHSYFIAKKEEATDESKRDAIFKIKMDYEIKPILREYLKDGIFIDGKQIDGKDIKSYIEDLG